MRALCVPLMTLLATTQVAMAQESESPASADAPETTTAEAVETAPAFVATSVPEPVAAYESASGPQLPEFHGYATQAFVLSDHNNYYQSRTNRGSARLTEVALNISDALTDRLRVVVQMSSTLSDEYPDVQLRLDFGFADYNLSDYLGVRVGRYRQLTGLYTEVWDTDIARTSIFLPSGVYDPAGRNFALSADGVQLYGHADLGAAGGLSYSASIGGMPHIVVNTVGVDVSLVGNGRLIYETPIEGLRVGGALTLVQFDVDANIGPDATAGLIAAGLAPPTFDGTVRYSAKGGGAYTRPYAFFEYANHGLTFAAEYSRISAYQVAQGVFAGVLPNQKIATEGFYALATYRFTDWFTLGGYSSFSWSNFRERSSDPDVHSFDYALTTRFDLNSYLALKLEGHHINGTSQLNPVLNTGTTTDSGWLFATRISAAF